MSKYDTMEAGPEMDGLVATRVMGWTLMDREACGWGKGPPVYSTGNEESPTYEGWSPSVEIGEAWRVLEKHTDVVIEKAGAGYWCQIICAFTALAPTAPLAICRAALKATEAQ